MSKIVDVVPNPELVKDALGHIIKIVSAGQERGCYTLDEAVAIQISIQTFKKPNSSPEESNRSVVNLITAVENCQAKGKLSLQEAYVAYQAIMILTKASSSNSNSNVGDSKSNGSGEG